MSKHSILVAIPALNGQVSHLTCNGLFESGDLYSSLLFHPGRASLTLVRDELAATFLRSPYETLALIDSDIGFTRRHFQQLVTAHKQYRFIGGAVPFRSPEQYGHVCAEIVDSARTLGGEILACKWMTLGFSLIHRSVFQAIIDSEVVTPYRADHNQTMHNFFPCKSDGGELKSECMTFCEKSTFVGLPPFLHCGVEVTHVGPYVYRFPQNAEPMQST